MISLQESLQQNYCCWNTGRSKAINHSSPSTRDLFEEMSASACSSRLGSRDPARLCRKCTGAFPRSTHGAQQWGTPSCLAAGDGLRAGKVGRMLWPHWGSSHAPARCQAPMCVPGSAPGCLASLELLVSPDIYLSGTWAAPLLHLN